MKIYMAGNYEDKGRLLRLSLHLENLGHEVVSSWIREPDNYNGISVRLSALETTKEDEATLAAIARRDRAEIESCDALVLFTRAWPARGGCHYEAGLAEGLGKKVYLVGPRTQALLYSDEVRKIVSLGEIA